MQPQHRILIVGGGFGGLYAARELASAPASVTVVDRRNFHLFQPLLYQVATGALSAANIAAPLRSILRRQANTRVLLGEVVDIDLSNKRVLLSDTEILYDTLIVATGSSHHYFGKEGWASLAPGLKTIEDATDIRRRILSAFEQAERARDKGEDVRPYLTFVVVGGGPTGVELAGAIAEIARDTLRNEFRAIAPEEASVQLLEMGDRILPSYPPDLSQEATRALTNLGVQVRTGTSVQDVDAQGVTAQSSGGVEIISVRTVLWAAGVKASGLTEALARGSGAVLDRAGRIEVMPDLTLAGRPNVFVIGDMAHLETNGKLLPAVAPVAMQQGRFVAREITRRLAGDTRPRAFRYRDQGSMATIGRSAAVVDFGFLQLCGFTGWLIWLFVHLMNLAQFENRVLVFMQWAWNYLTRNRSARLITGPRPPQAG